MKEKLTTVSAIGRQQTMAEIGTAHAGLRAKLACLTVATVFTLSLACVLPAQAQGESGQGSWETTLLGRDINLNAVSATSVDAVYLYDTTLNVTWLRNANSNGTMNWATATNWAANLSTGSGGNAISNWRLPTMAADPNPVFSVDGSTALGYNVPASSSEMASLFLSTLGNKSYLDTSGNLLPTGYGLTNTGSFQNLQPHFYWSGTEFAPTANSAWVFDTYEGRQDGTGGNDNQLYAMAVRSGDVAPVPEPETYAMLLAGLGLIGAAVRRRKNTPV